MQTAPHGHMRLDNTQLSQDMSVFRIDSHRRLMMRGAIPIFVVGSKAQQDRCRVEWPG
jgi:hypothetical protein